MNVQEFVLVHSDIEYSMVHVYDPVKAHEYYLQRRQLQGKTTGTSPPTPSKTSKKVQPTPWSRGTGKVLPKKVPPRPVSNAIRRRAETKARIEALKERTKKLRILLKELVKQAKIRSGENPDEKSKKEDSKGRTVTEDKKAAERSKDYYEKHKEEIKKETLTEQEKKLRESVKELEKKIADARNDIKGVINVAKDKSKAGKRNS